MANYSVSIYGYTELGEIQVTNGGTSGNPLDLEAGDTLTVTHSLASNISGSIPVGSWSSAVWTSTSTAYVTRGSSVTRTVKSNAVAGTTDTITCTQTGYTTGNIFVEVASATPPVSDSKPNSFGVASVTDALRNSEINFQSVSVTGNSASATSRVTGGVTQRKSPTGTFTTSDITVSAGDTVYLRATASSSYATTSNFTVRIGDLTGTGGENYDYETASFSVTTISDPGVGQTLSFPISSGTISMEDIIEFFDFSVPTGGVFPATDLGSYYRGGIYVPNVTANNGIPTSGAIQLDDFYGAETRWYLVAPAEVLLDQNTLSGNSSYTLSFTIDSADFGGGYGPNAQKNSQIRNQSIVEVWSNNAETLSVTGGSSSYTSNFSMTVSMTTLANTEREFYGYIPLDGRSIANTSITQTGMRMYFWFFFYGP
jgi:hypothetical protein